MYYLCTIGSVSSGVSAIQEFLMYWSLWRNSWDFQNCLFYPGCCCWAVSVKQGSTISPFTLFLPPLSFHLLSLHLSALHLSALYPPYVPTFLTYPPSSHPPSPPTLNSLLSFIISLLPLVMTEEWMKVHTNGRVQHGANTDVDGDYFFKEGRNVGVIKILEPMNPLLNYYEYLIVSRGERAAIGIGVCMPPRGTPLHYVPVPQAHTSNNCEHSHNVAISFNPFV